MRNISDKYKLRDILQKYLTPELPRSLKNKEHLKNSQTREDQEEMAAKCNVVF